MEYKGAQNRTDEVAGRGGQASAQVGKKRSGRCERRFEAPTYGHRYSYICNRNVFVNKGKKCMIAVWARSRSPIRRRL